MNPMELCSVPLSLPSEALAQAPPRTRPLVVELIGPAGSGKTTLARALSRRENIEVGVELPRLAHLPHLVRHSLLLLPVFLREGCDGWLSWKEARSMTYLRAWPRQLARPDTPRAVTLLDHGPVFRLARLRAHGPAVTRSARFERWWEQSLDLWSGLLDAVIALDAPDPILVDRIRSRDEDHRMKAGSRSEAEAFLRQYRATYREIVEKLEGGPQLLRVDTSQNSPDEVAAVALAQLERLVATAAT